MDDVKGVDISISISISSQAHNVHMEHLPAKLNDFSIASPGLLALSKAQTNRSFYRSDTNPNCS